MAKSIDTRCCIVGGGPAGMMLGYLLARAGVDVTVLEKHGDFLRDFRGDTIHPSTLELMHELGILEDFLKLPHQRMQTMTGQFGDTTFSAADFTHLPTRCKFIAFMPQWDFLNFLAEKGRRYPSFRLLMQTEATGLIEDAGAIAGVRATTADGPLEIRAPLTIGCDGRNSLTRASGRLEVEDIGAPMDVLWFHVSRRPNDPPETMGVFTAGHVFIAINRGDYWQCGYVIPKGTLDDVHRQGLPAFRNEVVRSMPALAGRMDRIADWDQVKLLTVAVDRLKRWYRRGLLCIGDAAHAMSPVGGVGINLAVQDAVATANILALPLRAGAVDESLLARVQTRREFPTRVTQRVQVLVQNNVITGALGGKSDMKPPLPVRLLKRFPMLRRIPARLVGLGVRPEHVRTPELPAASMSFGSVA
jgi:2-polyprenyl-6-methoxyphenol hydroxylase-like FAD-dependent oxidoreductase